jgi:PII-like signaling protein
MEGICLKFYTYENHQHKGILTYDWILKCAKEHKIPGGSVFRAIAGYGRHGTIHEEHFFELGANLPIEVVFILSQGQTKSFLALITQELPSLFYTKSAIEFPDSVDKLVTGN